MVNIYKTHKFIGGTKNGKNQIKKSPFYRIVVADSRYPRDGRFIEEIGTYNPLTEPSEVKVDADKVKEWIAKGAQPTDTVKNLFKKNGIL